MSTSFAIPLRATTALRQSPFPALRKLSVEESEGSVILRGAVSSYYLKQLAQETVMSVLGRRELCNQVKVLR
jgi:osmotically-inducible protein OsmY